MYTSVSITNSKGEFCSCVKFVCFLFLQVAEDNFRVVLYSVRLQEQILCHGHSLCSNCTDGRKGKTAVCQKYCKVVFNVNHKVAVLHFC